MTTPSYTYSPAPRTAPLLAYPNPAGDQVRLQASSGAALTGRLELLEMATGRVVLTKEIARESDLTVSVAKVPAGVYAGRLVDGTRTMGTCKIVVIH